MLIFLDTETTGLSSHDRLCEIAYKTKFECVSKYFNPLVSICEQAAKVNHITDNMLKDKPIFKDSSMFMDLQTLFNDDSNILVAHNAIFDVRMLNYEGLYPKKYICTQKLIKFIDKDKKIKPYNLQSLKQYFNINISDTLAHTALGDILVLEQLFINIYNLYKDIQKSKEQILFEMEKISQPK